MCAYTRVCMCTCRGNRRKGKARCERGAHQRRDREKERRKWGWGGEGVKKGWLPTRLNCIVDAPAHRISMRLFLTIAVLLVGKRKASALLAPRYEESLARLAEAYLVTGRLANRRYRTADPACTPPGKGGGDGKNKKRRKRDSMRDIFVALSPSINSIIIQHVYFSFFFFFSFIRFF